jgi:hypothetical protein
MERGRMLMSYIMIYNNNNIDIEREGLKVSHQRGAAT